MKQVDLKLPPNQKPKKLKMTEIISFETKHTHTQHKTIMNQKFLIIYKIQIELNLKRVFEQIL